MNLWELSDLCTPWCVHVAATLRIAEHIAAGHTEIADLAKVAGADADALHRVLRHLVSRGLFEESAAGRFALNEAARGLIAMRAGFDLEGFGGVMARSWGTLLDVVRTGKPVVRFWEELDADPNIAAQFDELMGPGHGTPDAEVLVNPADWDAVRTVVDVGGGTGSLLAEILRKRPHVRGTLVDMPRAAAKSAEVFAEAGVTERATAVAQSFFDPLPAGADVYVLKSVLSDWPDADAVRILRRCAEAAGRNGRVCVLLNTGPGQEASPELLMLVLVGGRGRSIDELRALGTQAGLKVDACGQQPCGKWIVELRAE
jgi:2,7-dihydroxy-5-methyl-1-naphthoate 7-O-methyltransferase